MTHTSTATRRWVKALAVGATLTLVATACASNAGTDGDSDGGGAVERALTSRAPGGTAPVDHITWNLPNGEPVTIDPPNAPTYSGAGVVSNLCDTLLAVDEHYNLGPNLVSYEYVTPTQLVYTLEADATFWDGTPLTVDDIVYSLQRAASPMSIVSFVFMNVASIEATGEREVTINFVQPDVIFNPSMATFSGMVIQQAFTEQAGDTFGSSSSGVMCSGPYELVSWTPGDRIELTKNENYWNKEVPLLADNVTFTFVSDSTAAAQALTAGEIDGSYEIPPSTISALEKSSTGQLFFGPSMQQLYLGVSRPDGPLEDRDLRHALQVVIDREALAEVVFHGAAEPLYTGLTPRTWPNDHIAEYQEAYDRWATERQFDIDRATELVANSTYDGTPLLLGIAAGDDTTNRVAQLLQQQAKKAGIEIEILELQPLEAEQAAYDAEFRASLALDLQMGSSFNAAQEPLEPIGFTFAAGAPYNTTGFDDPRAQEFIVQARQTLDGDERIGMMIELQEIIEEDSAVVPLLSLHTVTYLNNNLGGAITSFAYMSMPAMAYIGAN